jgi:hypothetical protein
MNTDMTYQELLDILNELEDDQLQMSVMIDIDEEYYNVKAVDVQDKDDRIKDGQPYFTV